MEAYNGAWNCGAHIKLPLVCGNIHVCQLIQARPDFFDGLFPEHFLDDIWMYACFPEIFKIGVTAIFF